MASGLRERKKQEARKRISDAATALFTERGFDDVTIAEIAEAAGYSKVTVFNYFPRKEDMFLDLQPEAESLLVGAIRERPPGKPVAEAVRELMHRLHGERHALSGLAPHTATFGRVIGNSPALRDRAREQRDELAAAVAALVAEETGDPAGAALVGDLLLTTVSAVVTTPIKRLVAGHTVKAVAADQPRVIDHAFDLLINGIGDVGAGPPA